jgi:hypothetical protein
MYITGRYHQQTSGKIMTLSTSGKHFTLREKKGYDLANGPEIKTVQPLQQKNISESKKRKKK